MFSFNCYICHSWMGNLPPIDALSADQSAFVGDNDLGGVLKRNVLRGTPYESMSAGSFCSFCIMAIQEFPSAIGFGRNALIIPDTVSDPNAYRIRMGIWTAIQESYPNADPAIISLLDSVFMEGIGYKDLDCCVPGCNNVTRTPDSGRWDHFDQYCSEHKGWYDLKNYIDRMGRDHWKYWWDAAAFHGHVWQDIPATTQCDCKDCFDVQVEYWDIEREAHEQWEDDINTTINKENY